MGNKGGGMGEMSALVYEHEPMYSIKEYTTLLNKIAELEEELNKTKEALIFKEKLIMCIQGKACLG